jgi:hypothetical protein
VALNESTGDSVSVGDASSSMMVPGFSARERQASASASARQGAPSVSPSKWREREHARARERERAASPSKWRYVREDAFGKLAAVKSAHHALARAVRAWAAHVRSSARNLALWVTARLAGCLVRQQAATLLAKLRHAADVSKSRADALR